MEEELHLGVYVPSYQRYDDKERIYDHLEYCTYVVRKSEEELYRKNGIENIWAIEDELIDSMHKVFQYIIDNAPEDIVVIIDDDGKMIYRNVATYDMTKEEAIILYKKYLPKYKEEHNGALPTVHDPDPTAKRIAIAIAFLRKLKQQTISEK